MDTIRHIQLVDISLLFFIFIFSLTFFSSFLYVTRIIVCYLSLKLKILRTHEWLLEHEVPLWILVLEVGVGEIARGTMIFL